MIDEGAGTADLRKALGRIGVWVSPGALEQDPGGLAARVERLGYRALWVGGGNADEAAFDRLGRALAGSSTLVLVTGITNIWAWEPGALAGRAAALEAEFPGRFVLGLGVSHAPLVEGLGRRYERPFEAMVHFLDGLDVSATTAPPRVLAALGDRMLELARDRSAGAHPYLTPPEHTEHSRVLLGAEPLLAPEQALVLETDPAKARATARAYVGRYLALPNYRTNLERLGYREQDFADGGSDRLVDLLVPHGTPEEVAGRIRAHLTVGADHVCIQPLAHGGGFDTEALETLAPFLLAT